LLAFITDIREPREAAHELLATTAKVYDPDPKFTIPPGWFTIKSMSRASVRERVLALFAGGARLRAGEVAEAVGVSRQAAHRHLAALVEAGALKVDGRGRSVTYRGAGSLPAVRRYPRGVIAEDRVWKELATEHEDIGSLPDAARSIFHYAFTEMLNNAIEHSSSKQVEVRFDQTQRGLAFEVIDEGVGVFAHLRMELGLSSDLDALEELSKGKITTLPEGHTGEGIFFTSKVADRFEIDSGGLRWIVDNRIGDVAAGSAPRRRGTRVRFEASLKPGRTLRQVFDEYAADFEFTKTRIVVKLFARGDRFISRSEARRITSSLERFREVVVDFRGIVEVGQGFADEVFRIWAAAHPRVKLTPVNLTDEVEFMVKRALRASTKS
jgi:DNA-binding transcriptional ArsR family regulator